MKKLLFALVFVIFGWLLFAGLWHREEVEDNTLVTCAVGIGDSGVAVLMYPNKEHNCDGATIYKIKVQIDHSHEKPGNENTFIVK